MPVVQGPVSCNGVKFAIRRGFMGQIALHDRKHFSVAGLPPVMKSAVLVFPGINRERDMARALKLISGNEPAMVWHADTALPAGTDLVVIPGGFSYGDYLRCGAIAGRAPSCGRRHKSRDSSRPWERNSPPPPR